MLLAFHPPTQVSLSLVLIIFPAPFLSLLLLEATFKGGLPHMAPCVVSTNVLIKFNVFLTQILNCHKNNIWSGRLGSISIHGYSVFRKSPCDLNKT